MTSQFVLVLEHPAAQDLVPHAEGRALARIVEAHAALTPLLDFCATDPAQIALAVGMVSAGEEDGQDDLAEIDFGQDEWFDPAAALIAVQRARQAIDSDPGSVAAVLYDPSLRAGDVAADLAALAHALQVAVQQETRFHFLQRA